MTWLMQCHTVASNSGSVQKVSYLRVKRCITMRDEKKWVEIRGAGANVLESARSFAIVRQLQDAGFERGRADFADGPSAAAIVGQLHGGHFQ